MSNLLEYYSWALPIEFTSLKDLSILVDEGKFPNILELILYATGYALLFGILRIILTKILFRPLAIKGMKLEESWEGSLSFKPDVKIDQSLGGKSTHDKKDVEFFIKQNKNYSSDTVNKYLWERKRHAAVNMRITKFVEAVWRLVFYFVFCVMGYYSLFVEEGTVPWINETVNHWKGWPTYGARSITDFSKIWVQMELGCYIHQLMWTEVNRKDAIEMIVHHISTILLITFSWIVNLTRIGTSILLVHDIADIFLEAGKCFNYISKAKGNKWAKGCCDALFGIFAITFGISRLYVFPKYMVLSLVYEAPAIFKTYWTGYYIFTALLITLLCLHIFWFSIIARMVYRLATTGIDKDERSDDEEYDLDLDQNYEDEQKKKK